MAESTTKVVQGSCYCKAVQYQLTLPVKWCAHCHCTQCRHIQGAALVTWFGVDVANFSYVKGEESVSWFASSAKAKRGHCSHCATALFFKGDKWKDEIHITLESCQGDILLKPQVHVFYDRHVDYLEFKDQLDKYGGLNGSTLIQSK